MDTENTHDLFEKVVLLANNIESHNQDVSILFVDLVGSTAFKRNNGAFLGLQKTFIHNSFVTQAVVGIGEVVKYIGDEVMVFVKGKDHVADVCRLAKKIQQGLADLNEKNSDNLLFPIEAKIGIHSGKVLFWKYPGYEQLDPQGTVVDTAARIVGLAQPGQILGSDETCRRANLDPSETGPIEERDVKGIIEPIRMREIKWDGKQRGITHNPFPPSQDEELRQSVRESREELVRGNIEACTRLLRSALAKDPRDFQANLFLGEILTRQQSKLDEGLEYLEKAFKSNPNSPRLWLLKAFIDWQKYKKTGIPDALDSAIRDTERCLNLAEPLLDFEQTRLAQGNLAYYLCERGRDGDLERALHLCENLIWKYERIEGREMSGFMDTFAFVLLKKGGEANVRKARELLEDAIKRDRQNPYPHEHMAELIRSEQALGIKPVSGGAY